MDVELIKEIANNNNMIYRTALEEGIKIGQQQGHLLAKKEYEEMIHALRNRLTVAELKLHRCLKEHRSGIDARPQRREIE